MKTLIKIIAISTAWYLLSYWIFTLILGPYKEPEPWGPNGFNWGITAITGSIVWCVILLREKKEPINYNQRHLDKYKQ